MKKYIICLFFLLEFILISCVPKPVRESTHIKTEKPPLNINKTTGIYETKIITEEPAFDYEKSTQDVNTSINNTPIPQALHTSKLENTPIPTLKVPDTDLSKNGPWLLAKNFKSLIAYNSDGSGRTRLVDSLIITYSISPNGGKIAYITDTEPDIDEEGLQLHILSLPNGQDQSITNLQDPSFYLNKEEKVSLSFQAMRAIRWEAPKWSPNGKYLAFIGQQEGTTADLYIYNVQSGQINRLTDGPSHAYQISWSPNNYYIFHAGAWNFGTGAGYNAAGSWVISRDGEYLFETSHLKEITCCASDVFLAWQNSETLLMASWSQPCGLGFLISKNVYDDTPFDIWPYPFEDLAYDPVSEKIGFIVPDDSDFCIPENKPTGIYVIEDIDSDPQLISGINVSEIILDPSSKGNFIVDGHVGTYRILSDNSIEKIKRHPTELRKYSKQVDLWIFGRSYHYPILLIGNYSENPLKIFNEPISDAIWSLEGDKAFFVSPKNGTLYMVTLPEFQFFIIDSLPCFDKWTYLSWVKN